MRKSFYVVEIEVGDQWVEMCGVYGRLEFDYMPMALEAAKEEAESRDYANQTRVVLVSAIETKEVVSGS